MGSCLSLNQDPEARQDRDIQNEIGRDQKKDNKVKKILFLGSGGSGKSTIFKQLRQIYGEPMTRVERRHYVQYIHEQCITQMKHALDMLNDFQEETNLSHDVVTQNYNRYAQDSKRNENEDYGIPDLSDQGMEYADYVQSLHHTKYRLNDEIVNALKELWKEPAIKKMYDLRNITGIEDSSEYFWNILDTIADPNYIPDLADTLLVRKRTTGTLLPSVHCILFVYAFYGIAGYGIFRISDSVISVIPNPFRCHRGKIRNEGQTWRSNKRYFQYRRCRGTEIRTSEMGQLFRFSDCGHFRCITVVL